MENRFAKRREEIKDLLKSQPDFSLGLENVYGGVTDICLLDEHRRDFFYHGYSIKELADHAHFEEVAYLLLYGEFPNTNQFSEFSQTLSLHRKMPAKVLSVLRLQPRQAHPMGLLQTLIASLGNLDANRETDSLEQKYAQAIKLIGILPTLVAYISHHHQGTPFIEPRKDLPFVQNFLYMIYGREPTWLETVILDLSLILYAEHELNASSFGARVTASTNADVYSAIVGAIAALKGNLHGGANEAAMRMLLEIGSPENAESYLKKKLANHEKIIGFGHRVYRDIVDPRVPIMKPWAQALSETKHEMKWYEISRDIEELMLILPKKPLFANIDFWTASVYYLMGFPIELYTPIFVASRITGWLAHYFEQQGLENKLIRPRGLYTGPSPRPFVGINQRRQ